MAVGIYDLKCNGVSSGFSDRNEFRFSWKGLGGPNGCQSAYQLCAASSPERLEAEPDLWDSGWVSSGDSFGIAYEGRPLKSRERAFWRVRIRDNHGNESDWSESSWFETALMNPEDWTAQWIQAGWDSVEKSTPPAYLRKEFNLPEKPERARVYLAALGNVELVINGQRVGQDLFIPGWTDYNKRIQYLAYDVTPLLQAGENVLGAVLADGWYCGSMSWKNMRNFYGNAPVLLAQLECTGLNGQLTRVTTDSGWRCSRGPILESDHYDGEIYDARLEMPGWNNICFDASSWLPVHLAEVPEAPLELKVCPPVRRQEELEPISRTESNGAWIYDLGQNMVGWPRINVRANPGTEIRIRFAEILQQDGTLYTENYRTARSEDLYICKSSETETWEPRFTFHGFRYVELSGEFEEADVTGVVLHTDLPLSGGFECSNPLINRLQQNILWGQKSNFFEVPTDCPQRDERLGWTGDSLAFIRTAAFNMDISSFYRKWLADLRDAQREDGAFPDMAPFVTNYYGNAGWGDAGVFCPWEIYLQYGDFQTLEKNYEAMCRWVDYLKQNSTDLIYSNTRYGDWLAIDSPDKFNAPTPKPLIGTAFFVRCADILAMSAEVLGKPDDAVRFKELAAQVRDAFTREFVSEKGDVDGETQTAYLLALGFDLLPEDKIGHATERLVYLVESRGHLTTGFIGTPLLNPVLTKIGRPDLAYDLLFRREYPSWLYSIDQGATTMWERWNSYSHADGFGDAEMNSFNHYAYGAVGEWLYNSAAGIQPAAPGYRRIELRPVIDTRLTFVRAWHETPFGRVRIEWEMDGDELTLCGEIPFNTEADLFIPDGYEPVSEGIQSEQKIRLSSGEFFIAVQKSGDGEKYGESVKSQLIEC